MQSYFLAEFIKELYLEKVNFMMKFTVTEVMRKIDLIDSMKNSLELVCSIRSDGIFPLQIVVNTFMNYSEKPLSLVLHSTDRTVRYFHTFIPE